MKAIESIGNQLFFTSKIYNNQLNKLSNSLLIERYFPLFHYINEHDGPVTQQNLADYFSIDKSTITRVVDYFIVNDLLSKQRCLADKRKSHLILTAKGKEEIKKLNRIYNVLNVKSLDGVSTNDIATFQKVLSQIKKNLEQIDL
jgi:DNA-binding MarR family transcriptional regulator